MSGQRFAGLALAVGIALPASVLAEGVNALGRQVSLNVPAGYCSVSKEDPDEREVFEAQKSNVEPSGLLLQFAVPCNELQQWRAGKREAFSKWLQILVLKSQGRLSLVTGVNREKFVGAVDSSLQSKALNPEEIRRKTNEHLSKKWQASISSPQFMPMGISEGASMMFVAMTLSAAGANIPIVVYMGTTLVNQLPLGIYAFATPNAKGDDTLGTALTYIRTVHADNPGR